MFNVIIIDDEPWSREVIKALGAWDNLRLQIIGEAEDGSEGIRLIEELRPDIVITDMRMPGLEGVELLKLIKSKFPSLKIIVMSGYDDFAYLQQAIRSRAMEYLLKPISQENLNSSLDLCVQELIKESDNANVLKNTTLKFKGSEDLDRYLGYRQQISWHLLTLDKIAVFNTFEKLNLFLKSELIETEEEFISKIRYDLVIMLKEFLAENESEYIQIWKDNFLEYIVIDKMNSVTENITYISKIYNNLIDALTILRRNRERFELEDVRNHIDKHYMDPISLETLAQFFFISKEHLSRTFKVFTGENLTDYIIRKRMEKAKDLILEDKMEIKYVAEITGYDNIAYFYRVFKKHFGVTPGEMRRED